MNKLGTTFEDLAKELGVDVWQLLGSLRKQKGFENSHLTPETPVGTYTYDVVKNWYPQNLKRKGGKRGSDEIQLTLGMASDKVGLALQWVINFLIKRGYKVEHNAQFPITQEVLNELLEEKAKIDLENAKKQLDFASKSSSAVDPVESYYLGGYWDGEPRLKEFLRNGTWEHRSEIVHEEINQTPLGTTFFIKARAVSKGGVRILAVGLVTGNPKNGTSLKIDWKLTDKDLGPKGVDVPGILEFPDKFFHQVQDEHANLIIDTIGIERYNRAFGFGAYQNVDNFMIRDLSVNPVLGAKELAEDIRDILRNLVGGEKGNMFGVFGQWGRGKTFLINQVWNDQDFRNKFIRVDFHAWKYQITPASWAYLYEEFAKVYFEDDKKSSMRKWCRQLRLTFKLNLRKYGWWPLGIFAVYVLGSIIAVWLTKGNAWLSGSLGTGLVAYIGVLTKVYGKYAKRAKDLSSKYTKRASFAQHLGVQAEIQRELEVLVETWLDSKEEAEKKKPHGKVSKRILLVVEDIDRCPEEKIIQIVDALRVLLESKAISERVVVMAAIDERILKRAIIWKYHKTLNADPNINFDDNSEEGIDAANQIVHEYMDKLFLAGIKLNALLPSEREAIFKNLTNGKVKRPEVESETPAPKPPGPNPPTFPSSISKEPSIPNSVKRKTEPDFEISEDEESFLLVLIPAYLNATPRQIRILYYRYLLGKKLLSRQLEVNTELLHNFARLLLKYTLLDRTELDLDKRETLKSANENLLVQLDHPVEKKEMDGKTVEAMFNTLDTVIAY